MSGNVLGCHLAEGKDVTVVWGEATDAAKHPAVHTAAPTSSIYVAEMSAALLLRSPASWVPPGHTFLPLPAHTFDPL